MLIFLNVHRGDTVVVPAGIASAISRGSGYTRVT